MDCARLEEEDGNAAEVQDCVEARKLQIICLPRLSGTAAWNFLVPELSILAAVRAVHLENANAIFHLP